MDKDKYISLKQYKTKRIIFGSLYKLVSRPKREFSVSGGTIQQGNKVKLPGLVLESHISWTEYIITVVSKMGKGVAVTRKRSRYVQSHTLGHVSKSMILCNLDYCSSVWTSASKTNPAKL